MGRLHGNRQYGFGASGSGGVQVHMPSSFTKAFADRLDTLCSIDVLEATDHLPVRQGQAIIACGGKHLEVQKRGAGYWVKVTQGDLVNGHCPSVDR